MVGKKFSELRSDRQSSGRGVRNAPVVGFHDLAECVDIKIGSLAVVDDRFFRSEELVDKNKQLIEWDFLWDGHHAVLIAVDQVAWRDDE